MDNIEIRSYQKKEINGIREKVIDFLINLDEEKKTFWGADIPKKSYQDVIGDLVDITFILIVAYEKDDIVGLTGIYKPQGLFYKFLPFVRVYIVVKKDYQGRGIGTNLSQVNADVMRDLYNYEFSIVNKDNTSMRRINKKYGYITVHMDSRYHYSIKTYNNLMSYLRPFIVPLSKVILRLRFNK